MSAILHPSSRQQESGEVNFDVLKHLLEARLRELCSQDAELREQLASEQAATANTFVAGTEGARATESDDEVIALLHHEQLELQAVQEALLRIEDGSFGACLACGEPIGALRLSVLPEAALCVGCQADAERRAERRTRAGVDGG